MTHYNQYICLRRKNISPFDGHVEISLFGIPKYLRYVSDSGGSLRFWHVFGMMQWPDLSQIIELGHD